MNEEIDIDEFVEQLNRTKDSVRRCLNNYSTNISPTVMTTKIKDNGYKYNGSQRIWIKEIHTTSPDVNSHGFTLSEMELIRSLINKNHPVEGNLIDRIETLVKDDKIRKTIVISQSVGDKLDKFCAAKRVQKSSILELAIEDIIKRYE